MTPMLEKVARQMAGTFLDNLHPDDAEYWRDKAIAAVRALREPDEGTLQAMHEAMFVDKYTAQNMPMLGAGFEAAIDSILADTGDGE